MITKIEIDGFKSFKDFVMEFTPLTVIAGVNASGKSNLFDAIQLLSRISDVDLQTAFGEQRGDAGELFQKYNNRQSADIMSFAVEMIVEKRVKDNWGQEAELDHTHLRYEIKIQHRVFENNFEDLFVIHEQLIPADHLSSMPYFSTFGSPLNNTFGVEGIVDEFNFPNTEIHNPVRQSILSSMNKIGGKGHLFAVRKEMSNWRIMQLYPEDICQPVRHSATTDYRLTRTGKNLAGLLYRLSKEDEYALTEIARTLNHFLPDFSEVFVGYNEIIRSYYFGLRNIDGQVFSSQVLSEGTLRFLTLSTMLYDSGQKGVLCFEEPENGIHPYHIRSILQLLKDLTESINEVTKVQVIVNTHSPIVVDETRKWIDSNQASLWFMRTDTLVTAIEENRLAIKITKATPVFDEVQTTTDFTEQEQKVTIAEVKKYLNSIKS